MRKSKAFPVVEHGGMTAEELAGIEPSIVSMEDHFNVQTVSPTVDLLPWFATLGGTGDTASVADDAPGGLLKVVTGSGDDEESSLQQNGESYKLAAGKRVSFRAEDVQIDDVSLCAAFIGLAITDTSIMTTDGANAITDAIGFYWDGTDLFAVSGKNLSSSWGTLTTTKIDIGELADATDVDLAFHFDGLGGVEFLVDDEVVATITDTAATKTMYPDDEALTPTLAFINLSGAARTAYVGFVGAYQEL